MIEDGPPPVAELADIDVRFGGLKALDRVSLRIPAGPGIGAIIGPNGAGKTTLFNVLTGIVRPTAGSIRIDGKDLTGARPDAIFHARLARTFQGVRLFEHLTVEQNVLVAARFAGPWIGNGASWFNCWGGRIAAREQTREALRRVGLDDALWTRLPGRLTLMQRRLLEIARALAAKPRLLLLDEPAAGLSAAEKQEICALFRSLASLHDCRIIVVEHDMKLVMSIAETICVMNFGRLLTSGSPSEIQNDPAVIEAYLGTQAQDA